MPSTTISATPVRGRAGEAQIPREGPLTPDLAVAALRLELERGEEWYASLLHVVARWTAPEEQLDGASYRYLIAGEAFDWLLLAQRLLAEVADLVPPEEVEQLLVFGIPPSESTEEEFEGAIGAQKYSAHLNFQYGVVVEEVLLLAVELELQKAGRLAGAGQPPPEVTAYEHVYGKTLDELQVMYRGETEGHVGERVSQQEWQEFTYWCSKYRMHHCEPAKVASDTRKAMALLSRLEGGRARLGRMAGKRPVHMRVQ
jgi:hypothetical protein